MNWEKIGYLTIGLLPYMAVFVGLYIYSPPAAFVAVGAMLWAELLFGDNSK